MSFEETLKEAVREVVREEFRILRAELVANAKPAPEDRRFTVTEAAEVARVKACTVYDWIGRGLPAERAPGGRVYTILESDLRAFMRRGSRGAELDDIASRIVRSIDR